MSFIRLTHNFLKNHMYIFIGIIIGVFFNLSVTDFNCANKLSSLDPSRINDFNYSTIKTVLRTNVTRKSTHKPAQFIRPRYYSTELGIKEKLFVGVLTSEEKLSSQAEHINRTVQQLVNKVKFFITAQHRSKLKLNYSGLVGFTDARYKFRPFQVIKYIADNFLQDYDYYFLMNDFNYLNARQLKKMVERISVSMNVYMGTPVEGGSYCNLDAGILFSNSALQAMKEHLDWCVMHAATDDHSENLGRCIYQSTKLECQEIVQSQRYVSYKLKHFALSKNFEKLTESRELENVISVYPVIQSEDYHILHAYFSKEKLLEFRKEINELSEDLTEYWPPGERTGCTPATRFDVPREIYFNTSHVFHPDDYTVIRKHKRNEIKDLQNILHYIQEKTEKIYPEKYVFNRLINGYRKFDLSRGLDYNLDIGFRDLQTGKEVMKRYEVSKPLGNVEIIQTPYVTESNRITILISVEETEADQALQFITTFSKELFDQNEKAVLLLALLYQYYSSSKGEGDVFGKLKERATTISDKYKSEDSKIVWVSIRLPMSNKPVTIQEYKVIRFAIIDLALKKIGLESIVLVLSSQSEISHDFLNRVRMNTISGFQIYSPIPFRFYNPKIAQYDKSAINKNSGQFDKDEYAFISFYGKDYVTVRKKSKHIVPLIRVDNEISLLMNEKHKSNGNVFEMFVTFSENLLCLRSPDKSFKMNYYEEQDVNKGNLFIGTQTHLAKFILKYSDKIDL